MVKIVITGGPGAGKSTCMATVKDYLEKKGYKVMIVPEASTKLISSGIVPGENISITKFQEFVLAEQLHNEDCVTQAAALYINNYKDVVMLCDRGLADQMAYVDRHTFEALLNEKGYCLADAYAYDCIIHMVTAADSAAYAYEWAGMDRENMAGVNMARRESPEEAVRKDHLTQKAWLGASHLRVIESMEDFEKKKMAVIKEVFNVLGEPVPMEIERKFLIDIITPEEMTDESLADIMDAMDHAATSEILQTYLVETEEGTERRIRQRGTKKDGFNFYYTEKKPAGYGTREENEKQISKDDYLSLLMEADTSLHQILKTRCCFLYKGRYFELDFYPFSKVYAILEVEVNDINEKIELPPFRFVKEVTGDQRYSNRSIAKTLKITV